MWGCHRGIRRGCVRLVSSSAFRWRARSLLAQGGEGSTRVALQLLRKFRIALRLTKKTGEALESRRQPFHETHMFYSCFLATRVSHRHGRCFGETSFPTFSGKHMGASRFPRPAFRCWITPTQSLSLSVLPGYLAGVKESKAMFPRSTQTSSSTNSTSNGMRVKSRRATETGKWNRRGPALPGLMYRTLSRSNFPG